MRNQTDFDRGDEDLWRGDDEDRILPESRQNREDTSHKYLEEKGCLYVILLFIAGLLLWGAMKGTYPFLNH